MCSGATGMNTITKYGIVNAGTSFLNGISSYGLHQTNAFSQSLSCMVGPVYSAGNFFSIKNVILTKNISFSIKSSYCM